MKRYQIKDFLEIKSAGSPSFSSDGGKISFLSNNTGVFQLYVVSSQGGEPEQITNFPDPVSFAVFSPVKNEILFGKAEGGNEQTQFYLYSLETKQIKSLTNNPRVKYNFGQYSRDGRFIAFSQNERNGKDFDVYIMNMENGEVERVYDQGGSCYAIGFSPKNTYLGIAKWHTNLNTDLFLINIGDKTIELVTPHEGDAYFNWMVWLPDESAFYTITNLERNFLGISRYEVGSKKLEYIFTPEWDVEGNSVSYDGKFMATLVNEDGYSKLRLSEISSGKEIPLLNLPKTGLVRTARFSRDSKYLVLVVGDSTHTSDIWIYSIESHECKQLTYSHQGVPAEELVEPELFRFASFDGLQISAFVYLPKNVSPTEKIPVIINIHGGPESQYKPSLVSLTQYYVYQGYAVVAPNVRGSSGYGKEYLALDDIEKRPDSVRDLVSLHEHLKSRPQLDLNRVALMGGSYGGYMVLAALAFYPELWVAGVDIVGISNFITFLENTAPYRRHLREAEYGYLDRHRDLLHSISPINHIENIKSPLLVIHGANDPRVPLSEAEQVVKKLHALGRKAELIVYRDEGHGLSKLKNRLDAYPRVAGFLKEVFSR